MDINRAIKEIGLEKLLLSLFSNLEGVNYSSVRFNKETISDFSLDSFYQESNDDWNFGIGSYPMLYRSFNANLIDNEINKLLSNNLIDPSSFNVVVENLITSWNGDGFKVQKISNKNKYLIVISKEDVISSSDYDNNLKIHPFSNKIKTSIKGFNKPIYINDVIVSDNNFYSKNDSAVNIESNSKNIESQKIVFEYNPEDKFLRIKNESIKKWIDRNPKETIFFNIEKKCQILFSKENKEYKLNLFPPGGITSSWDSINEGEFEGKTPQVKFSSPIDLITPIADESEDIPDTNNIKENIADDEIEFESQDDFFDSNEDSSYAETYSSTKKNKSFNWLYILLLILGILLLLRYCSSDLRDGRYFYDRGLSYYESGDTKRALRDFNRSINVDDSFYDSYLKRSEIYIENEEYYEAIYDLNDIIIADENNWFAYYLRAKAYMNRAESSNASKYSPDYQKALDDFTSSINLNSFQENAMSYLLRGQVYQVLESENACDDFYVACDYGLNQACAIIEEDCYPVSGFMPYAEKFGDGIYSGNNNFKLDNSRGDTDFRVRSVFVRKGDIYSMERVPNGRYLIEWYEGNRWITSTLMSDNITKGSFKEDEDFKRGEKSVRIITSRVLLFNSPGGDFKSKKISEDDFLN